LLTGSFIEENTVRKSKQEALRTRERIVAAASEEFRQHGIVATGLADLMGSPGLTHGGFYKHFQSKDELITEAASKAMATTHEAMKVIGSEIPGVEGLKKIVTKYLAADHRDDPGEGCPFAALGAELARCDEKTRDAATRGLRDYISVLASHLDRLKPGEAKNRATAIFATMVGALILARIANDEKLSQSILRNAQEMILDLA
jgi:TetR/AcrR family transcriptional regulator, transcriptional repressor for nem operon